MPDQPRKRPGGKLPDKPDAPPKKTRQRASSRPRLDAIVRAIKDGKYDDDMGVLMGAIQDRQRKRQEAVLALVHDTFGEDFIVQQKRANPGARGIPNGDVVLEAQAPETPEGWVDTTADATSAAATTTTKVEQTVEGEDEDGIESRSPIIGPFQPAEG